MKRSIKTQMTAYALTAILCSQAFAAKQGGSSGVGGGGTAVILPNDTVILADPFVSREPMTDEEMGTRVYLKSELKEDLERAVYFMKLYSYNSSLENFETDDKSVDYRMVKEIPSLCPYAKPRLVNLPEGAVTAKLACTFNKTTWIVEDLFLKLSIREQTKLLIHERLRAVEHFAQQLMSDAMIADVTDALEVLLGIYNDQLNGKRDQLTDKQVETIVKMKKRFPNKGTEYMGRSYEYHVNNYVIPQLDGNHEILLNGGGIACKDAQIDPTSYIGIGSAFWCHGEYKKQLRHNLSHFKFPVVVGKNVEVINSLFGGPVNLADGVSIKHSRLQGEITVGANTRIEDTQLYIPALWNILPYAPYVFSPSFRSNQSFLSRTHIGSDSVLSNVTAYNLTDFDFPSDGEMRNVRLSVFKNEMSSMIPFSKRNIVPAFYKLRFEGPTRLLNVQNMNFLFLHKTQTYETAMAFTILGLGASFATGNALGGYLAAANLIKHQAQSDQPYHRHNFKLHFEGMQYDGEKDGSACENEKSVFVDHIGQKAKIKGLSGLQKRCSEKYTKKFEESGR